MIVAISGAWPDGGLAPRRPLGRACGPSRQCLADSRDKRRKFAILAPKIRLCETPLLRRGGLRAGRRARRIQRAGGPGAPGAMAHSAAPESHHRRWRRPHPQPRRPPTSPPAHRRAAPALTRARAISSAVASLPSGRASADARPRPRKDFLLYKGSGVGCSTSAPNPAPALPSGSPARPPSGIAPALPPGSPARPPSGVAPALPP